MAELSITLSRRTVSIIVTALCFSALLFIGTSMVDRAGAPITNYGGDPPNRQVRGVPFAYVQRSIAIGECEANNPVCDPYESGHHISILPLLGDLAFWTVSGSLIIWFTYELFLKRNTPLTTT